MEREKKKSEPQGFLYVLFAFFGFLAGRSFSKLNARQDKSAEGVASRSQPNRESDSSHILPLLSTKSPPVPSNPENTCKCCNHRTPGWKKFIDWGMLIATTGAFAAAAYYAHVTYQMLGQMQDAGIKDKEKLDVLRQSMTYEEQGWLSIEVQAQGSVTHYAVSVRYSGGNTPVSVTGTSVCRMSGRATEVPPVNFSDSQCKHSGGGNTFNLGTFAIYEGEVTRDFPNTSVRHYIQSQVTYTDYLPKSLPHETTACFYYVPGPLDGAGHRTTPIFAMCDGHNSMK